MKLAIASIATTISLASGGAVLATERPAARAPGGCSEGTPEPSPSWASELRPTQRIHCDYDHAELNRRLLSVLDVRGAAISIATVERALGLPRLHTAYDDPRSASYGATIVSKAGADDWTLLLSFDETFNPSIKSRPPRFRGTLRPVLIEPGRRGEIRLEINWLQPRGIQPGSPACLSLAAFTKAARRAGWRRRSPQQLYITHSGHIFRARFRKGSLEATTDVTEKASCIGDLRITREADRAEPAVTDAELERARPGS